MTITVRPLSSALGAEVAGVDFHEEIDDATREDILAAWLKYSMVWQASGPCPAREPRLCSTRRALPNSQMQRFFS